MPPATTTVAWPDDSSWASIIAAFMPEPHILLMVVAGVALSRPAPSAACRAGAWPWPAPRTLPKMRSSTSVGFTPACSIAALMATAPSCEAVTEPNLPCMEPIGVRLAPTMTMLSAMTSPDAFLDRFFEELAPDQHAADLVGAGSDVVELGVTEQSPRGEFVDVAVAAEALDRLERDLHGVLGGEHDAGGGILAHGAAAAGIERLRDAIAEGARGLQLRVHVGDLSLHELEGADRMAELLALVHVRKDQGHRRLHDTQGPGRKARALGIQSPHQHARTAVHFAEHVFLRDLAVLEHELARVRSAHAELVELLCGGESLHALLDDEGGHRLRALVLRGTAHVDDEDVGVRAVGDPHLRAVGDPAIALLLGLARHGAHHVASGAGLDHRERAHEFAAAQLRQVPAPLRLAAVEIKVVDAEIGVRAVRQPDSRRGARDLFHGNHVREITQSRAAIGFRHRHSEQSQIPQLAPHVRGKLVLRVDRGGTWRELRVAHALYRVT